MLSNCSTNGQRDSEAFAKHLPANFEAIASIQSTPCFKRLTKAGWLNRKTSPLCLCLAFRRRAVGKSKTRSDTAIAVSIPTQQPSERSERNGVIAVIENVLDAFPWSEKSLSVRRSRKSSSPQGSDRRSAGQRFEHQMRCAAHRAWRAARQNRAAKGECCDLRSESGGEVPGNRNCRADRRSPGRIAGFAASPYRHDAIAWRVRHAAGRGPGADRGAAVNGSCESSDRNRITVEKAVYCSLGETRIDRVPHELPLGGHARASQAPTKNPRLLQRRRRNETSRGDTQTLPRRPQFPADCQGITHPRRHGARGDFRVASLLRTAFAAGEAA